MFSWRISDTQISLVVHGTPHFIARGTELAKNIMEVLAADPKGLSGFTPEEVIGEILQQDEDQLKRSERFNHNYKLRLAVNPSMRARAELTLFINRWSDIWVTDDGMVVAWKAVTHDYLDKWTRTVPNHVGACPSMPRAECDDDTRKPCSSGLRGPLVA